MEITKKNLNSKFNETLTILNDAGLKPDNAKIQVDLNTYSQFKNEKKKRLSNQKYSDDYVSNVREQIIRQKEILRTFNTCSGNNKDWINSHLSNVNMEKFNKMLTGDFFDESVMKSMVCLASSAFLANSSSLSANDRIRSWIRGLKQMGTESVSGFAMSGNVGSGIDKESTAKGAFIMKAVRNTERGQELIHEVFCGMLALNRLRKMIPNFAYIYGYIECSAPIGSTPSTNNPKGKKIQTFCNTMGGENDVVQAIYENIAPAKDFGTLVQTCDGKTFMRYYLCAMLALHVAEREADFTHYDLHQENMLIRECTDNRYLSSGKKDFYIPYTLKFENGKMETFYMSVPGGIPTFIDYGRSHVKVDGRNYGMVGDDSVYYIKQNVYRDKCNPLHDAFKLLGMSLSHALRNKNYALFVEMGPLLRRFYPNDFDIMKLDDFGDKSVGFMMPIDTTIKDMEDYITYCIKYANAMGWEDIITTKPKQGSFILTPVSDRLEINVLKDIGLDERMAAIPQPQTFLELYDVLSKHALLINNLKTKLKTETNNETKQYLQNKIKELQLIYLEVRNEFIESDQFDNAYDFTFSILKEVCLNVIDSNLYKNDTLGQDIENMLDIFPALENTFLFIETPSNINIYFEQEILSQLKEYISQIGAFAEMRDTLSTIHHALEYIYKIYQAIDKKDNKVKNTIQKIELLHAYIGKLLKDIQPVFERYFESLDGFMQVFTEKDNSQPELYARWKEEVQYDEFEQYAWYFSTVLTLPSLFRQNK